MSALFLSPHNDDETLFGAFTLLRVKPLVVVVLRSRVQERNGSGVTYKQREAETAEAMRVLGCPWEQWHYLDDVPAWGEIERGLHELDRAEQPGRVYAPAPEGVERGHAHHDALGYIADRVFGADRVTRYLTYTVAGKSTAGISVHYEPEWVGLKLRALACYRSQFEKRTGCAEHFLRSQFEFYERRHPGAVS